MQGIGHLDNIGVEVEVLPEVGVHAHELPAVPVLGEGQDEGGWVVDSGGHWWSGQHVTFDYVFRLQKMEKFYPILG